MNMKLAQLAKAPSTIVPVSEMPKVDSVNTMTIYNWRQDRERQFVQHQHVTTDDEDKQKSDRWDQSYFNKINNKYRQQFEGML